MKAIQTQYKGYNFRSRLEARWAVYFDSLGIKWEYEAEGYKFENGTCYLPDFWLTDIKMFVEVKPVELTDEEKNKCEMLARESDKPVLMLIGTPSRKSYDAVYYYDDEYGLIENNFALSNYHNYPYDENRFYAAFDGDEIYENWFDDIDTHVISARSARFEHGQQGATL